MSIQRPVAIVGGGLAGLCAANCLQRHGIPVRIFEAGPKLAGLAQSHHDEEGFTFDFGAHFITNRLAATIGYSAQCRDVPRYGETVYQAGRTRSYPFGLLRSPRYVMSAVAGRMKGVLTGRPKSAAEWFRRAYGSALANDVAIPLTEAWSGTTADQLSPAVGEKIPQSIGRTMMLRAATSVTKRTVAIGYSGSVAESPHVWHVYPKQGMGELCRFMARDLEPVIHLKSPVESIEVEGERASAVRVGGERIAVSAVVSTAPVHVLPKMVRGTDKLDYLAQFKYRGMIFVNLKLQGRGLLDEVVVWTPEKKFPFFRLTETPLSMPWLAPEGKTIITVDIGCDSGDTMWTKTDAELSELCLKGLVDIIPDVRERYLGCRVLKTPLAYPIYRLDYEEDRRRFEQGTGIEGLYSIGRNGEFGHWLMEDVYWRTNRRMRTLMDGLPTTVA